MGQLLLGSVLVVPLLLARWTAGLKSSRKGLRFTVFLGMVFNAVYVLSVVYLYFKLA